MSPKELGKCLARDEAAGQGDVLIALENGERNEKRVSVRVHYVEVGLKVRRRDMHAFQLVRIERPSQDAVGDRGRRARVLVRERGKKAGRRRKGIADVAL